MDDYDVFVQEFRRLTGIDLALYKRPQMERRLMALRNKRGYENFTAYLLAAVRDRALLDELLDRMTINVSEFFRNKPRWDALADVLPTLARDGALRAWSAACSTGEEPYTLLLAASEKLPLAHITALGTDIDERALEIARTGVYASGALISVPDPLRSKYFSSAGAETVQVTGALRERVTFRRHNLLEDPFEPNWDLIICRNVMIYFTDVAKDKLYRKFSHALRAGGLLFVGSTEQIFRPETYGFRQLQPFFYVRQS